jgi:Ca2+-binding RTX toxin-like protein
MNSCRPMSTFLVVDPAVVDYQTLLNGIAADTKVLVLDSAQDGVEQITQALAETQIKHLHILSHGNPGEVQLGSTFLNQQSLADYAAQLKLWARALQGAEVFLYGCKVAAGAIGRQFIQGLKSELGTEITASTTLTGHQDLGGTWDLAFSTSQESSKSSAPGLFAPSSMAAYAHVLPTLVDDTFRFADVSDPNWRVGVGPTTDPASPPQSPFLTARDTVTGVIPGSPTGQLDAPGEGALRLTNNVPDQAAFVLYDRPINSQDGLTITFELYAYGGTTPERADGLGFFLVNGDVSPTQAGAFGGSLGYAQKDGIAPGIAGGYVGIGFDEYGNFSSAVDAPGQPVVRTGGPGRIPDSISVRAGAATNYSFVTGTDSLPFGIDNPAATTRDAARRTVKVDLTPEGLLTVRIDSNNDGDFLDPGESAPNLTNINVAGINGTTPPPTFKFGFASGTGDFNNIHEVRNLVVATLNGDPEAVSFASVVTPGSSAPLPGFSATDPNVADGDSVVSYAILTLPSAAQGVLYTGDPASGGVPVVAGATLTPAQIQTIFFQAAPGFSGSTFTYTATDSRGASDQTPATVTLTPIGLPPTDGNLPPDTASSSLQLPQNTVARVTGLSGTDPAPGSVTGFAILTLPPANQGVLYLGNPTTGGRPVTAGQILTPAQIQQIFFQSSTQFRGGQFTYTAIDDQGVSDPTPAVVNLTLDGGIGPEGCLPGKTRTGGGGNNNIKGTPRIDTLNGGNGSDRLSGLACNDVLNGGKGRDNLLGGGARDQLLGGLGSDRLAGNAGDDVLNLGLGRDRATGDKGNDIAFGRRGNDTIRGKGGNDRLLGGRNNDRLIGGANQDFLNGQQNNDRIVAGNGRDQSNGGLGNDRIRNGRKNDIARAGQGNDRVWGGNGNDRIQGNKGNDVIAGNGQRDRLLAGLGNDVIIGGPGNDRIRTGAGADRIVYKSALHGVDTILDFNVARDQIDLRRILDNPGYGNPNRFAAYVRLGEGTGGALLRVDSNGDVAGGFVRLAIIEGVAANSLTATNFLV